MPYNGFSGKVRNAVGRTQQSAFRSGKVPRASFCMSCGRTEGRFIAHLEDYDAPFDYLPHCYACHTTLHGRFKRPEQFLRWRTALHDGFQPVEILNYNWHQYRRLYMETAVEDWTGLWGEPRPTLVLFDLLPMEPLESVPEGLAVSQGDPYLPGQFQYQAVNPSLF